MSEKEGAGLQGTESGRVEAPEWVELKGQSPRLPIMDRPLFWKKADRDRLIGGLREQWRQIEEDIKRRFAGRELMLSCDFVCPGDQKQRDEIGKREDLYWAWCGTVNNNFSMRLGGLKAVGALERAVREILTELGDGLEGEKWIPAVMAAEALPSDLGQSFGYGEENRGRVEAVYPLKIEDMLPLSQGEMEKDRDLQLSGKLVARLEELVDGDDLRRETVDELALDLGHFERRRLLKQDDYFGVAVSVTRLLEKGAQGEDENWRRLNGVLGGFVDRNRKFLIDKIFKSVTGDDQRRFVIEEMVENVFYFDEGKTKEKFLRGLVKKFGGFLQKEELLFEVSEAGIGVRELVVACDLINFWGRQRGKKAFGEEDKVLMLDLPGPQMAEAVSLADKMCPRVGKIEFCEHLLESVGELEVGMAGDVARSWAMVKGEEGKFDKCLGQNWTVLAQLMRRDRGSIARLNREFGIIHFGRYSAGILEGQLKAMPFEGQYAVVVNAYDDWNGALYSRDGVSYGLERVMRQLADSGVVVAEARDRVSALRRIKTIKKRFGGTISPLVIGGHGDGKGVALGRGKNGRIEVADLKGGGKKVFAKLKRQGVYDERMQVIFDSCSAGAEGGVAQTWRDMSGNETVGFTAVEGGLELIGERMSDGWVRVGVTFTEMGEGEKKEYKKID